MKKKRCSKCRVEKPLADFPSNNSRKDGLNPSCRKCHSEYTKQHYKNNKSYYKAKAEKSNAKYHEETKALLSKFRVLGCSLCPEKDETCLSAHHLDPSSKEFTISLAISRGMSVEKLREELTKCICVCLNCHAKLHAREREALKAGSSPARTATCL